MPRKGSAKPGKEEQRASANEADASCSDAQAPHITLVFQVFHCSLELLTNNLVDFLFELSSLVGGACCSLELLMSVPVVELHC